MLKEEVKIIEKVKALDESSYKEVQEYIRYERSFRGAFGSVLSPTTATLTSAWVTTWCERCLKHWQVASLSLWAAWAAKACVCTGSFPSPEGAPPPLPRRPHPSVCRRWAARALLTT